MVDVVLSDKFANNPQAYFNGYVSCMRNVFLTTTVGVAVYGFSKGFNNKKSDTIMRLLSSCIYIFAFLYLLNTNTAHRTYLNKIEGTKVEDNLPEYVQLSTWRNFEFLAWFYSVILIFVILISLKRFIKILLGIN